MSSFPPAQPVGLQLRRQRGFNLQALSFATNRLPAAKVMRRTIWGNPFPVSVHGLDASLRLYEQLLGVSVGVGGARWPEAVLAARDAVLARLPEIAGKNLACTCKLPPPGQPDRCHRAILLRLANPLVYPAGTPVSYPVAHPHLPPIAQGVAS